MDFVDEKDVAAPQIGQNRREIARLLDGRPGGDLEVGVHFMGKNVAERCLPQPRRPIQEDVVQRVTAVACCIHENLHLVAASAPGPAFRPASEGAGRNRRSSRRPGPPARRSGRSPARRARLVPSWRARGDLQSVHRPFEIVHAANWVRWYVCSSRAIIPEWAVRDQHLRCGAIAAINAASVRMRVEPEPPQSSPKAVALFGCAFGTTCPIQGKLCIRCADRR